MANPLATLTPGGTSGCGGCVLAGIGLLGLGYLVTKSVQLLLYFIDLHNLSDTAVWWLCLWLPLIGVVLFAILSACLESKEPEKDATADPPPAAGILPSDLPFVAMFLPRTETIEIICPVKSESGQGPVAVERRTLRFTTPEKAEPPREFYVTPAGDNSNSGLDAHNAWRTIGHAAGRVNAGDAVWVAPGTYTETVRVRATGTADAPITFQALPGAKTILNGSDYSLHQGFAANAKSHLRFDGFTFIGFNMVQNAHGPSPALHGEFVILGGEGIRISRCFADGRGGYPAHFIRAVGTRDLLVENCVMINNMSGAIRLVRCPDFRMRHCVIASPMIGAMVIDNLSEQSVILENNIFTDMLKKKSDYNFDLLAVEAGPSIKMANNGFLVRSFPPSERTLFGLVNHAARESTPMTVAAFDKKFGPTDTIFGDPVFAGASEAAADQENAGTYLPDLLMNPARDLYFPDYFATSPEYVSKGIGLQPEAFANQSPNGSTQDAP